MFKGSWSVRAHARHTVLAASLVLALCVPAVALAANTATFSLAAPKPGSASVVATPTFSVVVYDRYGVKGAANYTMTIDGVKVRPSISYVRGYGYKKFKLTFKSTVSLTAAAHTATVKIHDLKSKNSTYSWRYTVLAPPVMPISITPNSCASCHVGFPGAHPMDNCLGCHSANSPPRPHGSMYTGFPMSVYGVGNTSAHTLGCMSQQPCHGGGGIFPHKLDADCTRCHNPAYPAIRQQHGPLTATTHDSTNTFCTQGGCHAASLTVEHYRHTDASGKRLSCETCHSSTNADVRAALAAKSTDCVKCHTFATHPGTETQHALPQISCTTAACHGGPDANLASIHAASDLACAACHAPGKTLTSTCTSAQCHPTNHDLPAAHAATPASEVISINSVSYGSHACSECHSPLDLRTLHGDDCTVCHSTRVKTTLGGEWARGCAQGDCHAGDSTKPMHGGVSAAHVVATTPSCIAANCHVGGTDVAAIHGVAGGPGCAACHGSGKTPTLVCASSGCHPSGAPATHDLPVAHAATPASATIRINDVDYGTHACTECHSSMDLRTLHNSACAACHSTPVRGTLGGAWSHGCAQGNCHAGTSSIPMHGSVSASHTVATTPSCVAAGCHTGGKDVAAIHAVAGGPGCAACHGDGKTPTLNCVTCHPTYPAGSGAHASHTSTVTAGPISINGTSYGSFSCSLCHASLELQTVHGGSSSCAKCHPSPASTAAKLTYTCSQAGCHVTKSGNMLAQHGSINASHTVATTPSCIAAGCHTGGTDVAAIHAVAGGPGCAACHGNGKTPTLNCVTCHPTYPAGSGAHASHTSTVTAAVITINSVDYGSHSCSECHTSLELQTIHGGSSSCAKCHPSPASTAAKLTYTCSQAGCHVTKSGNMLAQHGSINASHTVATTPSCIAAGCHTGGRDVAAIHGVTGGPGCAACHGSGKTPTLNCVTCHPTYPAASKNHASHTATVTAGAISMNGTSYGSFSCSLCHASVELQTIHGGALSCVKCHPSPASTVTSGTFACSQAGCHVTKSGNMLAQHGSINTSHTVASTPSCIAAGCHTGGTDVAAIHGVAGGPGCLACHGGGKTPTLVCVTCHPTYPAPSSAHASHTSTVTAGAISINGTPYGSFACITCHTSLELQTIHGGSSSCLKCHPSPASTVTSGTFVCSQAGCHVTTSGNMLAQHGSINASHTVASTPSCIAAGCHTGGTDVAAIHGVVGGPGCAACHGNGKTPTLNCVTCHPTYPAGSGAHASHTSTVTAAVVTINSVDYGSHSCSECHTSLELQTIHGGSSSCSKCHPNPASTAAKLTYTCAQAGCHVTTSGNMLAQHGSINASHTVATTPSCIAAGCHTGGKDVAAIHGVTGGPGCAACHGNGKTPTLTCVTCHPTYPAASTNHASHASTVTAGAISINGTGYGSFSCALCHASVELQTVHGGASSCAKCHPSPASTVTSGTFACSQSGCHVTKSGNMLAQHGSVNASHTLAATPSCVGTGCHAGGTDVAAIHGVTGGPGCLACHGNGKTPTLNCVTCHPTYPAGSGAHASHTSTVTAGPISINGTSYGSFSCSLCHASLELQTVHGGSSSCAKCHPSPASTVTSGTYVCSQAGCHVTKSGSMLAQHGSINASHTVATTPSCIAAGCHTGGTDVAAIHGVAGGPGCAACHGGGKVPTLNCVTCHPTYPAGSGAHASHVSTVTATVITINSVDYGSHSCSECHTSLELQTIHGGSTSCAKCHPNPAGTAAKLTYTCAQAGCHVTKSGNMLAQHGSINASHTLAASPGCDCHPGGRDVAAIHGVTGGPGCAACHGSGKTPSLVCTDCHSSLDHIQVHDVPGRLDYCTTCHAGTNLTKIHSSCGMCHDSTKAAVVNAIATNNLTCAACHGDYHTAVHQECNDCHDWFTNSGDESDHGYPTPVIGSNDIACLDCHTTGGTYVHPVNWRGTPCHCDGPRNLQWTGVPGHAATPASATITIGSTSYGPYACSTCHSTQLITEHQSNCATCHLSPANSLTPSWNHSCVQGGCHTAGSSAPMHASVTASHTVATTPSCVGAGCHTGGTDVAAIHAVPGGPGCAACHGGGKVPTLVCSACHGAGLPSTHASHVPTTTASALMLVNGKWYGSHACSECHAPYELQAQHGENGTNNSCVKCHPTPATSAASFSCSQPACHQAASGNMQVMHAGVDAAHETTQGLRPCGMFPSCHPTYASLASLHSAVDTVTVGGTRLVSCQVCHANPAHAASAICSDCHKIHDDPTLHVVSEQTTQCTSCHTGNLPHVHLGCNCHASTDPVVIAAIKAHDNHCATCHGTGLDAAHQTHVSTQTAAPISINGTSYGSHSCSECHSPYELQSLHGETGTKTSCAKCHTDPGAPLKTGTFVCAQAGCHATTVGTMRAQHGSINTSHTLDSTPTCTGPGCHPGGRDVAAIHGVSGGPGCAACHGAGKKPSLVCATVGCHDTLDHIAKHDLPSPRMDDCKTCHAGTNLTTVQLSTGAVSTKHAACATCHESGDTVVTGAIASHDKACGTCHASLDHVGRHDVSRTDSCIDCHAGTNLTAIHDAARVSCVTCHGSADAKVIAAIASHTKTCDACHPTAHAASHVLCAGCHTHVANDPNDPRASYEDGGPTHWPLTLNGRSCASCHGTPFTPLSGLGTSHQSCGSRAYGHHGCHVGTPTADQHYVDRTKDACTGSACHASTLTNLTSLHPTRGCPTCHSADAPKAVKDAVAAGVTPTCAACHGAGLPATHASHTSTVTATVITINSVDYGSHSCPECHTSLELQTIHGGPSSCAKCHPSPASTVTSGTFVCSQAGCHVTKSGNMLAQHGSINASHTVATTPSCIAAGCHTGGTDVAAIHAVLGGPGCAACHGNGKTPTLNCVTCHPTYPAGSGAHASHTSTVTAAVITINSFSYGTHSCSECHGSLELQTLHGGTGSCAKCHPTPATSAPKGSYACAQTGCHLVASGNMQVQHASINTSHVVGYTPTCIGSGCHTGGADVARIHVTHGGCAACHGAGKTATLDCQTVGCHSTVDAHPYPNPHASVPAHDLGDAPSCVADACHSGGADISQIHAPSVGCAACHADGVTASTDCTQCHNVDEPHTYPDAHQGDGPTCIVDGCHPSDVVLNHMNGVTGIGCAACHENASSTGTSNVCADCHPGEDRDAHSVPYSHSTDVLAAQDITIDGQNYGSYDCTQCHPGDNNDGSIWIRDQRLHDSPSDQCTFCHFPNQWRGEWDHTCTGCHGDGDAPPMHENLDGAHQTLPQNAACIVCHNDGSLAAIHVGKGCFVCHTNDGSVPSADCNTCHPNQHANTTAAHTSLIATQSAAISILGTSYGTHACNECHTNAVISTLHSSCTSCHPALAKSVAPWNRSCVTGGCHVTTSGKMKAVHASLDTSHTLATVPTCVTTGCHTAGASGKDVAALHATHGGCAACHGGGKTPMLTCTASGCHPSGAPSNHSSHPSTVTSGSISINGVNYGSKKCGDCHGSMELQALHEAANNGTAACAWCHPSPRSSLNPWNGTCQQGGCHTVTAIQHNQPTLNSAHTVPATGCAVSGCHPADVAKIHGRTSCGACHANSGKPALTVSCGTTGCHPDESLSAHLTRHDGCNGCHSYVPGASYSYHQPGQIPGAHACTDSGCHPGTPGTPAAYQNGDWQGSWYPPYHAGGNCDNTDGSCHGG